MEARIDCGNFDGYDFADLNMLAAKYENSSSTKLRNTITTAVETTQSNGLGITAYFPRWELHGCGYEGLGRYVRHLRAGGSSEYQGMHEPNDYVAGWIPRLVTEDYKK